MSNILYASNIKKVWNDFQERFDRSNLTRIYHLWKAIATLRQGIVSSTSYNSKIKDMLDELAHFPSYDYEESRPSVEHLKSQCLLRPVVTVNESYAIVTQEESQRFLGVVDTQETTSILVGRGQDFRPKKPGLICEHCGYKGHLKENCFNIIRYPDDFKNKRKNQPGGEKAYANNVNKASEEGKTTIIQVHEAGQLFTEEQYK
ncbi:uncharacterized protein LOC142164317 [Nicotiana tabacum]|uniref:Uncharacterized protein LOC142164317 n=1 Tax=Nicotiana tabacum TaxID=4097 RepID=A0AC58S081_TOBAC